MSIAHMIDQPMALEALGGMLFYLQSLNLHKDLVSQRNFNIYDPDQAGQELGIGRPDVEPYGGQ